MSTIAPADQWGPFRFDIKPAERLAGLRSLRAVVRMVTGPRGEGVERLLRIAEQCPDITILAEALRQLGRLDALDKRKVWASYAALVKPDPV
jgi:hypothetical protein